MLQLCCSMGSEAELKCNRSNAVGHLCKVWKWCDCKAAGEQSSQIKTSFILKPLHMLAEYFSSLPYLQKPRRAASASHETQSMHLKRLESIPQAAMMLAFLQTLQLTPQKGSSSISPVTCFVSGKQFVGCLSHIQSINWMDIGPDADLLQWDHDRFDQHTSIRS